MSSAVPQRERAQSVDVEELELELLTTALARRWGYDFRNYARASLRRRVRRIVESERLGSISALQDRLLRDSEAMQRFLSQLSVHATAMFRDPAFYRAVRKQVVPLLKTYPFVRIWHAGCSTGEEVYSLAILLHEEGVGDRARIYATDLSDDVLRRAKSAVIPLGCMRGYTENYVAAGGKEEFSSYYLTDRDHAVLRRELRKNIVFSQHNLVSDGSFNEFHLVLCRNVLIYFDDVLRERVVSLLHDSLVRRGVLALGMKETLRYTPFADHFEALDEDVRLFRRIT